MNGLYIYIHALVGLYRGNGREKGCYHIWFRFNDIIPNDGDLDGQEVGAFNQNPRSRYKGL